MLSQIEFRSLRFIQGASKLALYLKTWGKLIWLMIARMALLLLMPRSELGVDRGRAHSPSATDVTCPARG